MPTYSSPRTAGPGQVLVVFLLSLVLMPLLLTNGCVHNKGVDFYFQPPELRSAAGHTQEALDEIAALARDAAIALAGKALDGAEAQAELNDLLKDHPVVSASTIDPSGAIKLITPDRYKTEAAANMAQEAHIADLLKSKAAVLGAVSATAKGPRGVHLAAPILNEKGELQGCVDVVIHYPMLIEEAIGSNNDYTTGEIWVMQLDGLILYDRDPDERGRNVLNDGFYRSFPGVVDTARNIIAKPQGRGQYTFLSPGHLSIHDMQCFWDTVKLHGVEWRVVCVRDVQ